MNEVIIIGGGPAGSAMGCYLSKAGIKNIILESNIHPRPHVGESMVTSTTRILEELDFLPIMEREGFVHKHGASWHEPNGKEISICFNEFPQDGIHQDYSYHVERSKFDMLLLKHAHNLGSEIYEGVTVNQVLFDENNFARGVRVKIGGKELDLDCKMVVDASGRNSILGRQLGLKKNDPIFNQFAASAWFENVDRGSMETSEFIHIFFLPVERGWGWQIPISDRITSIGVVAEKEIFTQSKGDVEAYFNKYAHSNAALDKAISGATRVSDFRTEGDYSYTMEKFIGNGYVLIGDAARFVDPIFSSGISIALYSARDASECIREAFAKNDFSAEMFAEYERKTRAGVSVWYEFIRLYYKLLPLFTRFIQSKKYRIEILRLLQGEVYDRNEVPVLAAMRQYIETVEKTENHIFRNKLTSIPIDDLPAFGKDEPAKVEKSS